MKRGSVILSIAFAACICVFWWRRWYLPNLYHGGYRHIDLLPYIVSGFLVVFFISVIITRFSAYGIFIIRYLLIYFILKTIINNIFVDNLNSIKYDLFVTSICTLLAIFVAAKGRIKFWGKVPFALLLAIFIFVTTPVLLAATNSSHKIRAMEIGFISGQNISQKNIVFIIFDETSPEVSDVYAKIIDEARIPHQLTKIQSAGKDTINAIPAMLLGMRFDDVLPCGLSTLCSVTNSVDFSEITAIRHDVDVVGFWHPYCSINGLRSCQRIQGLFSRQLSMGFICETVILRRFIDCPLAKGMRDNFLADMIQMLFSTPFWRDGGMLFVHLPIPHPSMEGYTESLSNDYHHNVVAAGEILKSILEKLQNRFHDDFLLIVTSDHALRINMWCSDDNLYPSKGCAATVPPNRGMVPLIVAGPHVTSDIKLPDSNVGILAGE